VSIRALRPSRPLGTGIFSRGKTRPGRDADHSPHLVPRLRISRSYTTFLPCRLHGGAGQLYFYFMDANSLCLIRNESIVVLKGYNFAMSYISKCW
jgi:hypothetical protein